jgi:tight adherence protein C
MGLIPIAIYAGFFVAIGLVVYVIADFAQERASFRRTLHGVDVASSTRARADQPREQQLSIPVIGRVVMPTLERFGSISRRFSPREAYERIEHDLVLAGSPPGWDAERILAWKLVTPFITGGLALLAVLAIEDASLLLVIAAPVIFAAAGWYGPEWIVRSRARERQHQIQLVLPDAIDLLAITVQAGLAFDAALNRVAHNVKGPLGQEMFRVVQEIQLGKGRGEALRSLSERSDIDDLHGFISAMVQADAFGIPIARVLQVQSREIRIRRRQRAEETAQKLPVKIVFPVVLTIFPALFVVLLGPAAIQIYETLIVGL